MLKRTLLLAVITTVLAACGGREHVRDLALDAQHAYVVSATGPGLQIFDLVDDASPVEVGRLDLSMADQVKRILLDADRLYLSMGLQGLGIVDLSDRSRPRMMGRVTLDGYAQGLAIAGDVAFVAAQHGGLRMVDVADPENPLEIASLEPLEGESMQGVLVQDDLAYVSDSEAGLHIIDVSNPRQPARLGALAMSPGAFGGLAYADGHVYVSENGGRIVAIDVTDPTRPQRKGQLELKSLGFDFEPLGDHLFVAESRSSRDKDGSIGVSVIDFRDPAELRLVTRLGGMGSTRAIAVQGSRVLVGDEKREGLWLLDGSDPVNPIILLGRQ